MKFLNKSQLMLMTGIKKNELDFLVPLWPEVAYTDSVRVVYNVDKVVEKVKSKKAKEALGLGNNREVYDVAVKKGIFSGKDENDFEKMSKKLRTTASAITTTTKHSEGEGRKLNYRLFRVEEAIKILLDFYSETNKVTQKVKTKPEITESSENKVLKLENSAIKTAMVNLGNKVADIKKCLSDRLLLVETMIEQLSSNNKAVLSKVDEIHKESVLPKNNKVSNSNESNYDHYRNLDPEEEMMAKYVVEKQNELKPKPTGGQVTLLTSLEKQIKNNNYKLRATPVGVDIVKEYYLKLSNASAT